MSVGAISWDLVASNQYLLEVETDIMGAYLQLVAIFSAYMIPPFVQYL